MPERIFKCTIGPFQISDAFSVVDALFDEIYLSVSCVEQRDDNWFVELLSKNPFEKEKLKEQLKTYHYSVIKEEILENIDWLAKCFENFKPMIVGEFFIYGPHLRVKKRPANKVAIEIAAATAFGTGEHPTTNRCLLACQTFFDPEVHKTALDIGCGSGILSIALAKLGAKSVTACDNDPEAVRITNENIEINGVKYRVKVLQNKGYEFSSQAHDFVVANILAVPLVSLAEHVSRSLKDGGVLVLSGFNSEDESVKSKYSSLGFAERYRYEYRGWMTLVMQKTIRGM